MNTFKIIFRSESGNIAIEESYATEFQAQCAFDEIADIKYPMTYKGLTINSSEFYTGGNIGRMTLEVTNQFGTFERRELFRNA